jgi:hypothetical protein
MKPLIESKTVLGKRYSKTKNIKKGTSEKILHITVMWNLDCYKKIYKLFFKILPKVSSKRLQFVSKYNLIKATRE